MDSLLVEQTKLDKKGNLTKTIDDVQKTIDLLTAAREAIAADGSSQAPTLAKLKRPLKASLDQVNTDTKEIYSALKDYGKALDKKFKPQAIPTAHHDALRPQPALTNRAIAMHLLREGQFHVATDFIAEASAAASAAASASASKTLQNAATQDQDWDMFLHNERDDSDMLPQKERDASDMLPQEETDASNMLPQKETDAQVFDMDDESAGALQSHFSHMYHILNALRTEHNLDPAIHWARQHSHQLDLRGSNLEFDLCRLRFVDLYTRHDPNDPMPASLKALDYARQTFPHFSARYMRETSSLLASLAFAPSLHSSPYKTTFFNQDAWEDAATSFTREFCGMLGLSERSPLYSAATAGAIALPVLEKLERVMGEVGGQWSSVDELPVEIPMPPSYLFHSIFVCPVSKEQATDANPPMMLPCGHVIAKESLEKISRGNKFKCPYCPVEGHPRDAKKVFM